MLEIKTIDSEKYKKMEDGIHVKRVGMLTGTEVFEQLKNHLENVGLLPDEYFVPSFHLEGDKEIPDFGTAICHTDWGSSEGIYIDISFVKSGQFYPLATGKTLDSSGEAFLKMSRIAAECSLMLNGRGCIVKVPDSSYENENAALYLNGLKEKRLEAKNKKPSIDEQIKSATKQTGNTISGKARDKDMEI